MHPFNVNNNTSMKKNQNIDCLRIGETGHVGLSLFNGNLFNDKIIFYIYYTLNKVSWIILFVIQLVFKI